MLPFLRAWTQEIVILIVLAGIIDLALPSGVMRKYVDYAVSLILLLLLLGPVTALLAGEVDLTALQAQPDERHELWELPLRPLSDQSTWLTYELLLKDRIAGLARAEPLVAAVRVEVSLERDTQSPSLGRPTRVLLTLTPKDGAEPEDYREMLTRLRTTLMQSLGLSYTAVTFQAAR